MPRGCKWIDKGHFCKHTHRAMHKNIFKGGSADIYKCFDQVIRPLLLELLKLSGCPSRVVEPYMRYLEGMIVYNSVAGTLGEPHKRKCSIPQGCPLSMTMIAFMLRPWIGVIKEIGAKPRILADDIMVWEDGTNQEEIFRRAYDATFNYIEDMGGKAAPDKSYTFSTNRITRQRLRQHCWEAIGEKKVKVVVRARDLGGQLCLSDNFTGATLTARMQDATLGIDRIRRTGYPYHQKAKAIRLASLPKALYGCEASPACDHVMARLRSAISNTIAPRSTLTSATQIFVTSSHGKDLDPEIVMFSRRILMLRRMVCKHEEVQAKVSRVAAIYRQRGLRGCHQPGEDLSKLEPCPVVGQRGRAQWNANSTIMGPIGLLIAQVHRNAATLEVDTSRIRLHKHQEIDIDVQKCIRMV